ASPKRRRAASRPEVRERAERPDRDRRAKTRVAWRTMAVLPSGLAQSPFSQEGYLLQLLQKAMAAGARDIHLKVGQPPGARVRGALVFFRVDKIRPGDTEAAARHIIKGEKVLGEIDGLREYDASYSAPGIGRFRVNVYRQRG